MQAPVPMPIEDQAIVQHQGLIYIFGGYSAGNPVANAFKYDPVANTWTSIAPLPAARTGTRAVSDGTYIYVVGGADYNFNHTATLYRYDPAANSYSALAPYTVGTFGHASVYLNGRIYRIAGNNTLHPGPHYGRYDRHDERSSSTNTVEVYTVSTNSWAPAAPYPDDVGWLSAVVHGNYIYTAGGYNSEGGFEISKTYRYDSATNTWDDNAIADLPSPRSGMAADMYRGYWIVAGGWDETYLTQVVAWEPTGNVWALLPNIPVALADIGGAATQQGFYAIGGYNASLISPVNQRYVASLCGTSTPTRTPTSTPSSTATPCVMTFSDVQPSDYFYVPVEYMFCHGIISGYEDNTFRPYNSTTRSQMVKIVVLGFGIPLSTQTTPTFADVPASNPFFAFVETASEYGIVSGYQCGGPGEPCDTENRPYFRPYNLVTRGQLSKIVVVAAQWELINPPNPAFSDVPPSDPFYTFVETAYCHGIISGYADGTFKPGNSATRGQIAKIVYLAILDEGVCQLE